MFPTTLLCAEKQVIAQSDREGRRTKTTNIGNPKIWSATSVFTLVLVVAAGAADRIIYVDADATGANDGSSWADAYNFLQDALADPNLAAKPVDIRVAQGVYTPDRSSTDPDGNGDRKATFQLVNGVTIKGGYAGFGHADPNARNIGAYHTILSGDLASNDVYVTNPFYLRSEKTRRENSLHVVTGSGTNVTAVLDGFTITGGNDNRYEPGGREGIPIGFGGGMCNESGRPTITNCTLSANSASSRGGAIYNHKSSPTLTNCIFSRNYSAWVGGGMYNSKSNLTLNNCVFTGNAVGFDGGGMANWQDSNSRLSNCTFSGNRANFGGAVSNHEADLTLTNCTFTGNRSTVCNTLGGRILGVYSGSVRATNCIFWDGPEEIWNNPPGSRIEIGYCNIEGSAGAVYDPCEAVAWGPGNIDTDPCFAAAGHWADPQNTPDNPCDDVWVDGDYHLKSQAGRWDPPTADWVQDDVTSPCIDAGNPQNPIGHESFPNGGVINMGAYGGTAEASKSYFGEPVCETIIAGDINGDCTVNFNDFMLMAFHWLTNNNP